MRNTLALRLARFGPEDPDTLHSMNNLAVSYARLNRHQDAFDLDKKTYEKEKRKREAKRKRWAAKLATQERARQVRREREAGEVAVPSRDESVRRVR